MQMGDLGSGSKQELSELPNGYHSSCESFDGEEVDVTCGDLAGFVDGQVGTIF
jgi:hypothetical protein